MPVTTLTDKQKMSTSDLVQACSDIVYDKAISSEFAAEWEELRTMLDELERRIYNKELVDRTVSGAV